MAGDEDRAEKELSRPRPEELEDEGLILFILEAGPGRWIGDE